VRLEREREALGRRQLAAALHPCSPRGWNASYVVIVRVSALVSLALGVYGFLASLTVWGVVAGAVSGAFALLFGWAALTEQPLGWPRQTARAGIVAGGLALVVCAVWVTLAILGI
jgi:hypothetical protein